jgi:dTDP-4-dehydrorhamnose reductase
MARSAGNCSAAWRRWAKWSPSAPKREGGLCGDFTDPRPARTVRGVRPDVIVNAAAYTAVDKAESEPRTRHAVNAAHPGVLARRAREIGAAAGALLDRLRVRRQRQPALARGRRHRRR